MANPAASPAVSSTVGLKNVVIAPLVTDTEAEHTYGELQLMAGAIEAWQLSMLRLMSSMIRNTL